MKHFCLAFYFFFASSFILDSQASVLPQSEDTQKILQLSKDPEWIRLGHYARNIFGQMHSSIRGDKFFLSPDGNRNPADELLMTWQKMFAGSAQEQSETQCAYLARRDFLIRKLGISSDKIKPCEFSDEWMARLGPTQISVIFASSYLNSAASSFGHTFLKLQDPKNQGGKELLDYGVNFAARTDDKSGALYALYGLFGFFPGQFGMLPYHQMIKEYTDLEGRDLWEYQLNFSEQETRRLVFHLLELEKAYFDYYFLDDNCSYQLLKLLEVARPGLNLASADEGFVIPLETIKDLTKVPDLVAKVSYRPSLVSQWQQRQARLNSSQKNELEKIYHTHDLNEAMSPEALSTAQLLVDLKMIEAKDQNQRQDLQKFRYEISRRRAGLGGADEFVATTPKYAPEQGLDSGMIALGYYDLSGVGGGFLKFRPAFHDFFSADTGVSKRSHLEILGMDLRSRFQESAYLKKITLLKIISSEAVSEYFKNSSWGVELGAERIDEEGPLQSQLKGNYGYRFDFLNERLSVIVLAAAAAKQNPESKFKLMPGADLLTVFDWTEKIRSGLSYEALFETRPQNSFYRLKFEQIFQLSSRFEARALWANNYQSSQTVNEIGLGIYSYFLF